MICDKDYGKNKSELCSHGQDFFFFGSKCKNKVIPTAAGVVAVASYSEFSFQRVSVQPKDMR